jgi:predicted alpha/beta hydrolase
MITIQPEALTISASDGYPLAALLFAPTTETRGAVQINAATGVPKQYYVKFAHYLAEHGFASVVYDYRGIGGSRPASLRGFNATMREWGQLDMTGVLDWLAVRYPTVRRFAIGHSVGAQLIGLMPNHRLLHGVIAIASSSGYYGHFPMGMRLKSLVLWYGYEPVMTRLFGYLPSQPVGLGEDLPLGVVREWRAWCTHPDYFASSFGRTIHKHYYEEITLPIKAFWMTDDPIANACSVPAMLQHYRNAQVEIEAIAPEEAGVKAIGHLGFFVSRVGRVMWERPLEWMAESLRASCMC